MAAPVERKVQASTGAAAASGIVLWLIGRYVFRGTAVPDVFQSWIYTLAPAVVTFGAGYLARHTPRVAAPPVITVNTTATQPANIGSQVPPEKTLQPPAAPEPPAAPTE